jgi:hypothetical protein
VESALAGEDPLGVGQAEPCAGALAELLLGPRDRVGVTRAVGTDEPLRLLAHPLEVERA